MGRNRIGGRVLSYRNIPGNPEAGGTAFGPGYARLVDAARTTWVVTLDRHHADHPVFFPARNSVLSNEFIAADALAGAPAQSVPRTRPGR